MVCLVCVFCCILLCFVLRSVRCALCAVCCALCAVCSNGVTHHRFLPALYYNFINNFFTVSVHNVEYLCNNITDMLY